MCVVRRHYVQELAANNPPEFICHFYNVYFAHSAGGRMIGRKVKSQTLIPLFKPLTIKATHSTVDFK